MLRGKFLASLAIAFLVAGAAPVLAADCVLHVTRTACPGQEKESFSKCGGSASCIEKKPAASTAECVAAATAACANSRTTITKYKKVTADFEGAAVESGKDFCVGNPDYPYAAKEECK